MKAIYNTILILLFISMASIEALSRRLEIILNREPVLLDKCLLLAQSAYS